MIAPLRRSSFVLRFASLALVLTAHFGLLLHSTGAQETGDGVFQLPSGAEAWINSPPLTVKMLAGKAAYLYYFEESCPSCRARWPALMEAAKKYAGKPILFIAVNSGNPRAEIQQYVRQVGLTWPVIVDPDRSFEKACGLKEISLQNIYQGRLLMPEGRLAGATWEIDESVPRALPTAKWRVDPAEVPASLKAVWQQVEFGSYLSSAAQLKKSVNSVKPDEKAAAEKLMAVVKADLDKDLADAQAKYSGGEKWPAYKAYVRLGGDYKGYDVPSEVQERIKELTADETVRNELAAYKLFETSQRQQGPAALAILKRIVKQYPDTEAAQTSLGLLEKFSG